VPQMLTRVASPPRWLSLMKFAASRSVYASGCRDRWVIPRPICLSRFRPGTSTAHHLPYPIADALG